MEEKLLKEAYEKSKDYLYEDSSRYNLLSIIEKDRDEAHIHSKVIYNLLSQNWEKKDKETFLTLFLKEIGIGEEVIYNEKWEVSREKTFDLDTIKGRLDFEIKSKDYIYIIEMKIDAGDQPEQLIRYQEFAKKQHKKYKIFYLTLDGHSASKKSIGEEENLEENEKVEYTNISFKEEILNWLGNCLDLIKGKENKLNCVNQYIASINKILGEKDTKIKDNILKSVENIKNAISLYGELNDELQVTLENFMSLLKEKLKTRIGNEIIYYKKYVKNYYKFVLKLELAPELIGCLGFIKNDSDEKETIPFVSFNKVKKDSSGLYNRCLKRIENLEVEDKLSDNNRAYWYYIKNSKGEIINFKDISLSNKALLSLIDEETLKEEAKNIATYISNEIVKNMEI